MSAGVLALVLTAAVLHACWNIAAKRVSGAGYAFVWWYQTFSAILWLPVGLIMLANAGWPGGWGLLFGPIVSAVFHVAYGLWLQTGYDKADLGIVYPVARGVGPLVTMLVAIGIFRENPGLLGVLGGLVIIAGIVIVATGRGGTRTHSVGAGLRWGAMTGVAISAYTLWDDHSVHALGLMPVPYFALGCVWQSALIAPGLARQPGWREVLRTYWREIGIVALLSPGAYILVLLAMQRAPVAVVAPARESSIVIGSLLGWWLFKEPNPLRKLLGSFVVLTGIALTVL